MVDVDSAMRASAYGGGKRRKKSDEDKQKEKDDRVMEPFDQAATAKKETAEAYFCLLYTSPSPRDRG